MSDTFWAAPFLVLSLFMWIYWAVGLFTDCAFARLIRGLASIAKRRPDLFLFHPAVAAVLTRRTSARRLRGALHGCALDLKPRSST